MTLDQFMATLPAALNDEGRTSGHIDDIVKAIRRDLALARKAGLIQARITVRKSRGVYYSARGSVTVTLQEYHGAILSDEATEYYLSDYTSEAPRSWLSPALKTERDAIHRIANRHNHDHSDWQTDYHDVGYYLSISTGALENLARTAVREEAGLPPIQPYGLAAC